MRGVTVSGPSGAHTLVWTAAAPFERLLANSEEEEEVGKKDPVAVCFRVVVVVGEHVHVYSINRETDDGTTRAHKSA